MRRILKGGNVLPSEYFGGAHSNYQPVSSHTSLSGGLVAQSFGELLGGADGLSTGPNLGVYQSGGARRVVRRRRRSQNKKKGCGSKSRSRDRKPTRTVKRCGPKRSNRRRSNKSRGRGRK